MVVQPTLHPAGESHNGVLVWQWAAPMSTLSSASVGGGLNQSTWLLNIGVVSDYARTDLENHANQIATEFALAGNGQALFTAADVARFKQTSCGGVVAHATVGVAKPTWAADPAGGYTPWTPKVDDSTTDQTVQSSHFPGTINLVVQMPVGLEVAAAVNAVMTITEAKTQALHERGVPGTGTASDAVVLVWPTGASAERFAGSRSKWGARIAQAAHAAVRAGIGDRP